MRLRNTLSFSVLPFYRWQDHKPSLDRVRLEPNQAFNFQCLLKDKIMSDPSPDVKEAFAEITSDLTVLKHLMKDPKPYVRKAVAGKQIAGAWSA